MTRYDAIVGQIADRFRWWANPPAVLRPTPALAGWTLDEWLDQAGIVAASPDERFQTQWPSPVELRGYPVRQVALEAMRLLVREDEVEPTGPETWRARAKLRLPT